MEKNYLHKKRLEQMHWNEVDPQRFLIARQARNANKQSLVFIN